MSKDIVSGLFSGGLLSILHTIILYNSHYVRHSVFEPKKRSIQFRQPVFEYQICYLLAELPGQVSLYLWTSVSLSISGPNSSLLVNSSLLGYLLFLKWLDLRHVISEKLRQTYFLLWKRWRKHWQKLDGVEEMLNVTWERWAFKKLKYGEWKQESY